MAAKGGFQLGETYVLGDSPLVLPDHLIRVWYDLDVRLLMADLYAKLTLSKR